MDKKEGKGTKCLIALSGGSETKECIATSQPKDSPRCASGTGGGISVWTPASWTTRVSVETALGTGFSITSLTFGS